MSERVNKSGVKIHVKNESVSKESHVRINESLKPTRTGEHVKLHSDGNPKSGTNAGALRKQHYSLHHFPADDDSFFYLCRNKLLQFNGIHACILCPYVCMCVGWINVQVTHAGPESASKSDERAM